MMKTYLLPIFALLIVGCGNQPNTEEWPIKPTNEIAARLIELDSISRAIMENSKRSQYEDAQILQGNEFAINMRKTQRIADSLWHTFIRLCNNKEFEDAFNLYQHDNNFANITVALQHSTARYLLHNEITATMAFKFLPEKEAYQLIIRDFECDMLMVEAGGLMTDEKYIPTHYADLAMNLADTYLAAKCWDKALDLTDKLPEILSTVTADNMAYAGSMMYKARIYKAKGDILESLKTLRQLKAYLVKEIKTSDNKEELQDALQVVDNKIEEMDAIK